MAWRWRLTSKRYLKPPHWCIEVGMTWIKTLPPSEGDEHLRKALAAQKALYPLEYTKQEPAPEGAQPESIVASAPS